MMENRWPYAPQWARSTTGSARRFLPILAVGILLLLSGCSRGSGPVSRSDPSLDPFRAAFDLPRPEGLPSFPDDGQYYVGVGKSGARVIVRSGCVERTLMFKRVDASFECVSEFIMVRGPKKYDDLDLGRVSEELTFSLVNRSGGLYCEDFHLRGDTPTPRSFERAVALASSWIERCTVVIDGATTPPPAPKVSAQ